MEIIESALHLLVVLGVLAMGARYGLAKEILDYHRDIIGNKDAFVQSGVERVVLAVYRVCAAGCLAVAAAYAVFVFRVQPSAGFGEGYALLTAVALGLPSLLVTFKVEKSSGVKTPWRIAAVLLIISIVAYFV